MFFVEETYHSFRDKQVEDDAINGFLFIDIQDQITPCSNVMKSIPQGEKYFWQSVHALTEFTIWRSHYSVLLYGTANVCMF